MNAVKISFDQSRLVAIWSFAGSREIAVVSCVNSAYAPDRITCSSRDADPSQELQKLAASATQRLTLSDRFNLLLQNLLPKQAITSAAGRVAGASAGRITTRLIRWFVKKYGVDMTEAANADIGSYKSFNDFFTRPLRLGARPLALADFVCPVDGAISQFGAIDDHQILQAKGHRFTTAELVGGDKELAAKFRHGAFANLYLSPKDYHRLHMPCDGLLTRMIYVPGTLFSVNPATARSIPNLFARNERVVCVFESRHHGPFVMVLVGATIVGSIATTWHGVVNPKRVQNPSEWTYPEPRILIKQGDEMGRFLLGSTIVMLFVEGAIAFNENWAPQRPVRLGEVMGSSKA
ncbi:archaetidylserine decarboxylase [Novosphingobium sp. PhB57]|uniref:archaetidylserine decarboxylase n=1 Tax=Novosphingobium sp. PhB57 TaxID=2485107 RepID=UPI001FB4F496|nr:archaetidylserine decarboxylase [Novosphingobium sp. PhB57]